MTGRSYVHCRRKSLNTNGYCAQTNRQKKMVDARKWSAKAVLWYYQMTCSSRRLTSAQYAENCQNWPNLTFKRPATAIFFRNLRNRYHIWNQRIKLHPIKCREENFGTKSLKGVTLVYSDESEICSRYRYKYYLPSLKYVYFRGHECGIYFSYSSVLQQASFIATISRKIVLAISYRACVSYINPGVKARIYINGKSASRMELLEVVPREKRTCQSSQQKHVKCLASGSTFNWLLFLVVV